ncbi:hypothetical protein SAMN02745671_02514 [Anaerovibrio lipolyticus DSM 3074]|uniref:Uncharacterized protein n=1 Tax=Anaerovibrio lipolyticus DSM 3074 TaxID=1120997 RepID=A0A1M6G488_9FIRM|nr:hypothetical protein [Anaerovibrio lipolyticus]SHJ04733.1 hypothetical protein SAMN02745671_02514 [Anaerovibrio lipolyticus DSM 3074]
MGAFKTISSGTVIKPYEAIYGGQTVKLSDLAERVLCEIYDNLFLKKGNAICSYELGVSSEMFVETWRELSGENEDGVTYTNNCAEGGERNECEYFKRSTYFSKSDYII